MSSCSSDCRPRIYTAPFSGEALSIRPWRVVHWKSKAKTTAEFSGKATWLLSTDPLYPVLQINTKDAQEKQDLFHGQEQYGFHPGIRGSSEHSQKPHHQACFLGLVQWLTHIRGTWKAWSQQPPGPQSEFLIL